jgi:hypothetical protein
MEATDRVILVLQEGIQSDPNVILFFTSRFFFFFLFWANSCLPSCDHGVSCVFKLQSFEPCPNFLA